MKQIANTQNNNNNNTPKYEINLCIFPLYVIPQILKLITQLMAF